MLDLAINHEDALKKKIASTMYNEKYKFFNFNSYYDKFELKTSNIGWSSLQCVSVVDGEVIGYMYVSINQECNYFDSIGIINFSDNKIVFGRDLYEFFDRIFSREDMFKLCFKVAVGNPIEPTYDKFINKYGGRIVGTYKNHIKLFDGKLYDMKMYEITREQYLKNKERRK